MADAPRTTGPIEARESTLRLLRDLRTRSGVSGPANLQLQALADVEMAFATRFPDDLLAVWAAAAPVLTQTNHLRITGVFGLTAALLEQKARADLVCVGRGGDAFLCVEKRQRQPGCELLVVNPEERSTTRVQLDEWLAQQLQTIDDSGAAAPSEFAPQIVRPLPAASSGTCVRHATFGDGNVLREIGTGPARKLQVDFPKFGLKMLQARFVEYLD